MKYNSSSSTFINILSYLWSKNNLKLKIFFILSISCIFLSKASNAVAPFIFKMIFDKISGIHAQLIAIPIGLLLFFALLRLSAQIFNELKEGSFAFIEQNAVKTLALEIFTHLHNLSLSFHLNRKTGQITKAIERGVKAIETILRFSTFNIIPTFFEVIIVCVLLLIFYPVLYTIIIFSTLVFYCWYTIAITKWRTKWIKMMKNADNTAGYKAMDSILNYETVKYFNKEEFERQNYSKLLENYKKLAINNRISLSILNVGQAFIIAFGIFGINFLTIKNIILGSATVGDFALMNAYLAQLYIPLANLGFSYREIKLAYIDIENMFSLLEEREEIVDKPNAKPLTIENGLIEFKNVFFKYNKKREIIKGVNLKIYPGEVCAIVGKSGSGKSTILRLLFRFYDITSGNIIIDEQNLQDVTQKSVRQAIGVVSQETVLFNDTIFYNIAYGADKKDINEEKIKEVARLADIHNFIESLPEKYNTLVGERGLKLSGGEKQRVAIARLLLKNSKIFIFDEATSSLDTKAEKVIQKSINQISVGHTTIIIAHRLSTIVNADKILVLDDGQIIEQGNHHELIDKKGTYWEMWQHQKEKAK